MSEEPEAERNLPGGRPSQQRQRPREAEGLSLWRDMENRDTLVVEGVKSDQSLSRGLQDLLTCAICKDYFRDPVTEDSGDTFCRSCLPPQQQTSHLHTNWKIQSMVQVAQKLKLCLQQSQAFQKGWCPEHQEPLSFFCQEDHEEICFVCRYSNLHQGHTLTQLQGLDPKQEAGALDRE
ncbi:tripartite motif-containing protein 72-like [Sarcophilus harrisii]|uniref:tripartite motif-containing protein 72-like n=1 Tax=Sarcophilus harrisii TaxID=9305 RepID=UPI001301F28F|nr:tripartite motif-containing protein 72-like [Sarcophilus harrisii]